MTSNERWRARVVWHTKRLVGHNPVLSYSDCTTALVINTIASNHDFRVAYVNGRVRKDSTYQYHCKHSGTGVYCCDVCEVVSSPFAEA